MNTNQINGPVTINIRAKNQQRDLIDLAAKQQGRSRSEFMLDVACREAENFLLDQAFFTVNNHQKLDKLQSMFDEPFPASDQLVKLLKTKSPWEK